MTIACVLNDKCGFLGNTTQAYCLKGNEKTYDQHQKLKPSDTYSWDFDRCPGTTQEKLGYGALASLIVYLIFFAPGLASTPWTVNSEIYPVEVRGTAISIATTVNWIFNLAVSMTFITLMTSITPFGTFGLYAGIAVCGTVFLICRLPETKGYALEDIQSLFHESNLQTIRQTSM